MKNRPILTFKPSILLGVGLLAVLLLGGCAPASTPAPEEPQAPAPPAKTTVDEPAPPAPTATVAISISSEVPPTEAPPAEAPQPVATSRGDSLEATDPSAFASASGELQLVEFFAYW